MLIKASLLSPLKKDSINRNEEKKIEFKDQHINIRTNWRDSIPVRGGSIAVHCTLEQSPLALELSPSVQGLTPPTSGWIPYAHNWSHSTWDWRLLSSSFLVFFILIT